jgi:lipopolysaccharide export system protein LptC
VNGAAQDTTENGRTRRSRSRAFARAQRHSRWVRFYKIAIPLGAVVGIAGVGFVAFFDPFRSVEGLTLGPVSVSGTQVTMEAPKLTGYRDDSRPYEVTASAAVQDVRKPNLVELKNMKARIVTDDQGGAAHLEATTGILDTRTEKMELRDNVRVRTDAGQEALLRSASVNFKAGTVVSKEPVTVSLGNGVIKATGLTVTDNGKVMHFKGRVQTVFEGNAAGTAKGAPAGTQKIEPLSSAGTSLFAPVPTAQAEPTSLRP